METMKNKIRLLVGIALVLAIPFLIFFWYWVVMRVEVRPSEVLIVTNLWGNNLPEGEIIAPDDSYKGILLEPKREGRHFINPLFHTYERAKLVQVPPGQCLVLTRKYGTPIPADRINEGDFLARDGERGVVKEVLKVGNHAINPYAYTYQTVPMVVIKSDQVGVRTLKAGKDPRAWPRRDTPP